MRKPNKILSIGMLVIALTFALKHFHAGLPDFAEGFLIGIGLALELIGLYAERHDLSKFRNLKLKLLGKLPEQNG